MKKAEGMLGAIVIVLIVIIFFVWLIGEAQKECRRDSDCNNGICNSNFECVSIQKSNSAQNFNTGALILGVALIIAALIMKWDKIFGKKEKKELEEEKEEKEDSKKLSKSHKAEEKCLYEEHLDEQE